MDEYLRLILRLLMYLIPAGFVVAIITYIVGEYYIRTKVRGGTLLIFWNLNREVTFELVKARKEEKVTVGDRTYTLDPGRQFNIMYPFWAPPFLQERIPALFYTPSSWDPVDPLVSGGTPPRKVTSKSLTHITDEAMLGAVVKDAREAAEEGILSVDNMPLYALIAAVAATIMAGVAVFFLYQITPLIKNLAEVMLK